MTQILGIKTQTILLGSIIVFAFFCLITFIICKLRTKLSQGQNILQFSIAKGTDKSIQPYSFTDQIILTQRKMSTTEREDIQNSGEKKQDIDKMNNIQDVFSLESSFAKQKKRIFKYAFGK